MATSKTFKQLARLAGAPPQRRGPFVPRTLAAKDLAKWLPRVASMTARRRAKLKGVSKPRARQIVAGAVVAKEAMAALDVSAVRVCPWALREGVMLHYLQDSLDTSQALPLHPVTPMPPEPAATIHALPPRAG